MRLELLCDGSYLNAHCVLTRAAQRAGWAQRRAELSAASLGQTDRFGWRGTFSLPGSADGVYPRGLPRAILSAGGGKAVRRVEQELSSVSAG